MATGLQQGFSLDEVNQAAKDGMLYGGALGAGSGVFKAGMEGAFSRHDAAAAAPAARCAPTWSNSGPAARNADRTPCVGEPIDVATGAMLMTADGPVAAGRPSRSLFQRTHLSSYRGGVCFGPTWISTLDECVQIDGEGVVFAAADGMRLVYPVPEPGVPALPVKGARWPLEWDGKPDGVMTITDPATGVVRTFSRPGPLRHLRHLPPAAGLLERPQRRPHRRRTRRRRPPARPAPLRRLLRRRRHDRPPRHGPAPARRRARRLRPRRLAVRASGTVVMRYAYDERRQPRARSSTPVASR